jgi:hypothetical protein
MEAVARRERILELFEKHRAVPGAPYDEARFIDYLLANPLGARVVHNSFRGLRRYNAFIDDVQYEFAVCFSRQDFEGNYSLSRFVDRVAELEQSRRGSLASLKNQIKAGPGWHTLIIGDLILLLLAIPFRSNDWFMVGIVGVATVANLWFARFAWRSRQYLSRLRERIQTAL